MIKFDFKTFNTVTRDNTYNQQIHDIRKIFESKSDNLGWYNVDKCISSKEIEKIKKVGNYIRKNTDIFIVIGTSPAYLNSQAIISLFQKKYESNKPEIIYVGNNLSALDLREILTYIQDKEIVLNVISTSGNTIETNLMFDVFYDLMEAKYENKELKKRIIVTTDSKDGRLRKLVKENGFVSFPTKKNVPERYAIATTIGLLPMCVAGVDIDKFLEGYKDGQKYLDKAYIYAVLRDIMYHQGRKVEIFTSYEPRLEKFLKYLQMLFGQSQGKKNAGILPMKAINTDYTNIIGQYLTQGDTITFETVIAVINTQDIEINEKSLSKINHLAMLNYLKSHQNHTPGNIISISKINEKNIGELVYYFLVSSAIGSYLMDVNPYDDNGLNKYKKSLIESIGEL